VLGDRNLSSAYLYLPKKYEKRKERKKPEHLNKADGKKETHAGSCQMYYV